MLTGLFSFDHPLKGTAEWADELTLVFRPRQPRPSVTIFKGILNLSKQFKLIFLRFAKNQK